MDRNQNDDKTNVPINVTASTLESPLDLYTISQPNLEHVESLSNVCRVCATIEDIVIPIFEGEGLKHELAEKINQYLPIQVQVDEEMPMHVCVKCARSLLSWHSMYTRCTLAEHALRARLLHIHAKAQKAKRLLLNKQKAETQATTSNNDNVKYEYEESDDGCGNNSALEDDDDLPLASLAKDKTADILRNFYNHLVKFRNHLEQHDDSESSDSSESVEAPVELDRPTTVKDFDDLTKNNKRRACLDEETKKELEQAKLYVKGKLKYVCQICGKSLTSKHTYLFHKRIHTGERPCVCHICGKQFRSPSGLLRHVMETHERSRRHACPYCARTFANSQNLKQHLRIHTGERPYVCAHCGKRFTQSGSLHVHLKTHTEEFPFVCTECGGKFRLRAGLTRHTLKHTGERPHDCTFCGKSFRTRHELNVHALSHSEQKPHCCRDCGAAFRQKRALTHHIKRVHEVDPNAVNPPQMYNPVLPFQ